MAVLFDRINALSEPLRVRLLHALEVEEFGVGELARILALPQSTVSRHLKVLHNGGWVKQRSEGSSNLFRAVPDAWTEASLALWQVVRAQAEAEALFVEDNRRRDAALALRRAEAAAFFERHADRWDSLRRELYGEHFWLPTLLSLLSDDLVVADLGCGTGEAVAEIAAVAKWVVGVDREQAMLDAATTRLRGIDNVELRRGGLTDLPLKTAVLDAAICVLVLHHVAEIDAALAEIHRVLKPGGRCVVLDLVEHEREEYRLTMGHAHLGFSERTLRSNAPSGLEIKRHRSLPVAPDALGPGLAVTVFQRA